MNLCNFTSEIDILNIYKVDINKCLKIVYSVYIEKRQVE